ncbi:hypothetical protein [Polaromonas sp.]|uniref:hypothetical protein n=1 Tax=Polaromonas sp. TaxID=1869339 RepID=UPI002FCC4DA8
MKRTTISMLCVTAGLGLALIGCGKKEAAPVAVATPAPVVAVPAPTAPTPVLAVQPTPSPAASTDPDSPMPLPAKEIKGVGIKQKLSYYYALNAGAGPLKITATAKNSPSGATQALAFGLYDLKANKLCSESHGNTNSDKTITLNCSIEKAQPLILRLDLSEETIDYMVALDGPVELPPPQSRAPQNRFPARARPTLTNRPA